MREIKSQSEYKEIITSGKPVLLDFYADWCGPCQALLPTVEKLADRYEDDFIVAKINVDKNRSLAQQYGIRSIPSLFFLQDGKIKENLLGLQTESFLEQKIQKYSAVTG